MVDWKSSLTDFFEKEKEAEQQDTRPEFDRFITEVVLPAFSEIAKELEAHGRWVTVRNADNNASIMVQRQGEEEITYRIGPRTLPTGELPVADIRFRERKGHRLISIESMVRSGSDYQLGDITQDNIVQHFVENYTTRVRRE